MVLYNLSAAYIAFFAVYNRGNYDNERLQNRTGVVLKACCALKKCS